MNYNLTFIKLLAESSNEYVARIYKTILDMIEKKQQSPQELNALIEKFNLKANRTIEIFNNKCVNAANGSTRTRFFDFEVAEIMPPLSRFRQDNLRSKVKAEIIAEIEAKIMPIILKHCSVGAK